MNMKTLIPKGLDDIEKLRRLFSVSSNLCTALSIIDKSKEGSIGCSEIKGCGDGCILYRIDTTDKFNTVSWLVDNGYITKGEALGLTLDFK